MAPVRSSGQRAARQPVPTTTVRNREIVIVSCEDLREAVQSLREAWELRRKGLQPTLPTNIVVVCAATDRNLNAECSAQIEPWVAPVATVGVHLRLRVAATTQRRSRARAGKKVAR